VGIAPFLIVVVLHTGDVDLSRLGSAELKARAETAFDDGNRHRDDPDAGRSYFRAAATAFEEIHRRGARNATLYRNLGHSYLLAGDLPHAILAYQRGLRYAPGNRDLNAGLDAARERVAYPPGSRLGRPGPAGQASSLGQLQSEWIFAGAAFFYASACICATRWLMTRRGLLLAGTLVALPAAGLLTALAVSGARDQAAGPLVVIVDDGVLVRKGDSLSYPPRYQTPVNRGVEARLLTVRGNWLQIELSGGETGWVMREYALVDEESES
jgi:hypothetical protein